MKQKVVVGMSGGVDSSVAAYLLKEQGYDVIGVTMQIWQDQETEILEEQGGCCGLTAVDDARRVANLLEIPYYVMNFKKEFDEYVIRDFVNEYRQGRTPNPCIRCNRYVKWESLLNRALQLGADFIATGHYARVVKTANGRYSLCMSATQAKDQTYALYNLTQEQLSRTLMPVGDYTKDEIRGMARKIGLMTANKPDSQEICFVPDKDYAGFIKDYTGEDSKTGNFVAQDGSVLGRHQGIMHYTIGQRKGLGSFGHPVFVSAIRPETNEVVLGSNEALFQTTAYAEHVNYMAVPSFQNGMRATAKIRYSHKGAACRVSMNAEGILCCVFDEPQRAITPGQALVLYDQEMVLGGGTIIGSE